MEVIIKDYKQPKIQRGDVISYELNIVKGIGIVVEENSRFYVQSFDGFQKLGITRPICSLEELENYLDKTVNEYTIYPNKEYVIEIKKRDDIK